MSAFGPLSPQIAHLGKRGKSRRGMASAKALGGTLRRLIALAMLARDKRRDKRQRHKCHHNRFRYEMHRVKRLQNRRHGVKVRSDRCEAIVIHFSASGDPLQA
jgi:hypothetical protein